MLNIFGMNNGELLLMEEILHQLIGTLSQYRVFCIPGGAGFLPSTVLSWFWHMGCNSINSPLSMTSHKQQKLLQLQPQQTSRTCIKYFTNLSIGNMHVHTCNLKISFETHLKLKNDSGAWTVDFFYLNRHTSSMDILFGQTSPCGTR